MKGQVEFLIFLSVLLLFATGFLIRMKPSAAAGIVDESLKNRLEEENETDVMEARMKVQAAESSRVKVIQESIDASVSESASVEASISESESLEISREESIAASIAESISESESVEKSIEESIEASIEESIAASIAASEAEEQSIAESAAESVRESEAEALREAQERQAAEEAARREQEQRAAEEAAARSRAESEAAASTTEAPQKSTEAPTESTDAPPETTEAPPETTEATTEAPPETTPAPQPQLSGATILFGDSRTEGFIEYGLYPGNLIYWTWDPINAHYELANAAASQLPSKIVFLSGIDDIISYGAEGAIGVYEGYIAYFQSISPGTAIYVGSVLPVTDVAVADHPQLAAVPTYNTYIAGMCARHGWGYVDGSGGVSFANYYGDGIHMDSTASAIWLGNLRAMVGF